jgi:integrase
MPTQLPSGRWRPRVRHPRAGKHINPQAVIGGPQTYDNRADARRAEDEAKHLLALNARLGVTVREFWADWTTEELWLRPAESTNLHNRERTQKFVAAYGDHPLRAIGDDVAREWLRDGRNRGTVPALRAFFNDASNALAGRLVATNPFAGLRLPQSRGRRDVQPPAQADAARLIAWADDLTPPSFAAFLATAIRQGVRPGELDGLQWRDLDFTPGAETIRIERQWNAKARKLTSPKHGFIRTIAMTPPTRERLLSLGRESEWVFTTLRGTHYTPSSRSHHWNRVRCAAGLGNVDLYTATRHHFAWYARNVSA